MRFVSGSSKSCFPVTSNPSPKTKKKIVLYALTLIPGLPGIPGVPCVLTVPHIESHVHEGRESVQQTTAVWMFTVHDVQHQLKKQTHLNDKTG